MIPIKLETKHASGGRTSKWSLVLGLGHAGSIDTKPLRGEAHQLPAWSVLMEIVPSGTARSGTKEASFYQVMSDGELAPLNAKPIPYPGDRAALCAVVSDAVANARLMQELDGRMRSVLDAAKEAPNDADCQQALEQGLADLVRQAFPVYRHVEVTAGARADAIQLTLYRDTVPHTPSLVPCVVPCINTTGDPDFWFILVRIPEGYDPLEDTDDDEGPLHWRAARRGAMMLGDVEVLETVPVYDPFCLAGTHLMKLFQWDTASIVDLTGAEEES